MFKSVWLCCSVLKEMRPSKPSARSVSAKKNVFFGDANGLRRRTATGWMGESWGMLRVGLSATVIVHPGCRRWQKMDGRNNPGSTCNMILVGVQVWTSWRNMLTNTQYISHGVCVCVCRSWRRQPCFVPFILDIVDLTVHDLLVMSSFKGQTIDSTWYNWDLTIQLGPHSFKSTFQSSAIKSGNASEMKRATRSWQTS